MNLTGRLNGVFYPNMFCEIAKHIYSKLEHIKTQKEIDLLETRRELNNSFPIENIISIDK